MNQNIGAEEEWYSGVSRVLCGPRFAMLREAFLEHRKMREDRWAGHATSHRAAPSEPKRLVLTVGGSDPNDVTSMVVRALRNVLPAIALDVILGPGFEPHRPVLRQAALIPRVRLHDRPRNLPKLMAQADLAVTGGGSTVYECAHLGLPSLVIQMADNQAGVCHAMEAEGIVRCLGPWNLVGEEQIALEIQLLLADEHRLEEMARRGMALVDGHGARRVAEALAALAARQANG